MPSIQDIICSLFILVAAGSFGALYWYRIRRARRSGLECGECGYLTAHASDARCPECGTPWLKGDGRTFRRSRTSLAIIQTVLLLFPAGYALGVWSEGSRPVWGGRTEHVMWFMTTPVDSGGIGPVPFIRGRVVLSDSARSLLDDGRSEPTEIIFSTCSGYVQGGGRQRPTAAEMTPPESLVFRRMTPTDPWASENDQQPVGSQLRGWLERKYPDSSEASVNAFLDILTKVLDLDWSSPAMDEYLDDMETASFNWRFGDRTEPQPDMLMNLSSSFRVLVERDVPLGQAVIVLLTAGVAGVIWLRWWVVLRQHAARHESQSNVQSMNS
ncbi:MAG: hypothetical protein P8L37_05345 [Phycisphaerales bacterium]|nr:hypothetical protein [Phycisphaerales bacterium]